MFLWVVGIVYFIYASVLWVSSLYGRLNRPSDELLRPKLIAVDIRVALMNYLNFHRLYCPLAHTLVNYIWDTVVTKRTELDAIRLVMNTYILDISAFYQMQISNHISIIYIELLFIEYVTVCGYTIWLYKSRRVKVIGAIYIIGDETQYRFLGYCSDSIPGPYWN